MALGLSDAADLQIVRGIIAGPRVGEGDAPAGFEWYDAGHPDPNRASLDAGRAALALAGEAGRAGALLVLLSGGASAMLVDPAGVTLEEKLAAARALMLAGAPIDRLNAVRKHLSAIKGGGLAAAAGRSVTLAISDVHGPVADDPSVIGSGPTVGDPTTYADALRAIREANCQVPAAVLRRLERGAAGAEPETVKPGDPRLNRASWHLIGNRSHALDGARRAAEAAGYEVTVLPGATHGEARDAATRFLAEARRIASASPGRPLCVLAAGETTVRVTGPGRGGRNQEFALACVPAIASINHPAVIASAGTDGADGPTDAAGALVDPTTSNRAQRAGLKWEEALAANDSYNFFAPLGDLIRWGPTGTNVGDVQVLLVSPYEDR